MEAQQRFQVCKPISSCHRRGMQWFASLTRLVDAVKVPEADDAMMLNHSVQFYSVYAETGDERYLKMCEDFLRDVVTPRARVRR